jgi:hypothetical protein
MISKMARPINRLYLPCVKRMRGARELVHGGGGRPLLPCRLDWHVELLPALPGATPMRREPWGDGPKEALMMA